MKKLLLLLASTLLIPTLHAGVYRHDVDAQRYKDLAAQQQFECVGQVIGEHFNIAGSCVLVGDRYVLSAAHVFMEQEPLTPDTIRKDGSVIVLNRVGKSYPADIGKYSFRFNRQVRYGKRMIIHPTYLDSITSGHCDMVLIELSEPVIDIKPAVLNTSFDELHCMATGVGWGASGKGNEAENVSMWFEKIAGQNMIDTFTGYKVNGQYSFMEADFDHPANYKDCNKMGSPKPLPLEYMTSGGDSGGGLFRQKADGKWVLIGTCTGGGVDMEQLIKTGYYGQLGGWTRVSVFVDWINKTIKEMKDADTK